MISHTDHISSRLTLVQTTLQMARATTIEEVRNQHLLSAERMIEMLLTTVRENGESTPLKPKRVWDDPLHPFPTPPVDEQYEREKAEFNRQYRVKQWETLYGSGMKNA